MKKENLKRIFMLLLICCCAPFVIGAWMVAHPVLVWREAKKSWFLVKP